MLAFWTSLQSSPSKLARPPCPVIAATPSDWSPNRDLGHTISPGRRWSRTIGPPADKDDSQPTHSSRLEREGGRLLLRERAAEGVTAARLESWEGLVRACCRPEVSPGCGLLEARHARARHQRLGPRPVLIRPGLGEHHTTSCGLGRSDSPKSQLGAGLAGFREANGRARTGY